MTLAEGEGSQNDTAGPASRAFYVGNMQHCSGCGIEQSLPSHGSLSRCWQCVRPLLHMGGVPAGSRCHQVQSLYMW